MLLVLLDNASAEFAFLFRFFGRPSSPSVLPSSSASLDGSPLSPRPRLLSESVSMLDYDGASSRGGGSGRRQSEMGQLLEKNEKSEMEGLWHQIFDPALTYCQVRLSCDLAISAMAEKKNLLSLYRPWRAPSSPRLRPSLPSSPSSA